MNNAEILSHVDHTLLQATASWSEIQALCDEAVANQTASVCVPPSYIKRIADTYGDKLNICQRGHCRRRSRGGYGYQSGRC